jgi:zinc protease
MRQINSTQTNMPGSENIHRSELPNGSVLLNFHNANTKSVYLVGLLHCGSVFDPQEKLGLANFTAAMLTRGTRSQPFSKFHYKLENRGASLTFASSSNHVSFRGQALAEDAELLFELASQCLREPEFPAEYTERLRAQLLTGLAIRDQDTSEVASLLFDQMLFPNHPYGQPLDGYTHTVRSISRKELIQFHRDYFGPAGMIMAISGLITPGDASRLAMQYFADWQQPVTKKPTAKPVPPTPDRITRKHRHLDEKSQVDLVMGTIGPKRTSDDYLPIYLGNNILGQFGMMGRIGESVRSKSGLAYHASSNISAWQDSGSWEFAAGVNTGNLPKTIELIRSEIGRFIEVPVTKEELNDSKSHLVGRLPLSLESNAGLANAMLTIERFSLGLDYYQRYSERIQGITAEEILAASRRYLHPDKLVVASAGPGEEME